MRVLITGAAGFLGRRLTEHLIAQGELMGPDGRKSPIQTLILTDIADIPTPPAPFEIQTLTGDFSNPAFLSDICALQVDSLFHLASLLTIHAEQDPNRAFTINTEALRQMIDRATTCPRLVFASSIAVFGGDLPEIVDDDQVQQPTTSYGMHKAINELLIADYTRHGRIDGRALRLPIVVTRPGTPQPVVSDQVAAILREPIEGRPVEVPFAPDTRLPLASAGAVVRALVALHDIPGDNLPAKRAVNLPALTVTPAQIVAELDNTDTNTDLIRFTPDPALQAIVDGWPQTFVSSAAGQLGLHGDAALGEIIADYINNRGR